MAYDNTNFWADFARNAGPGLLEAGMNWYGNSQANKEAEDRLKRSQGPLYDKNLSLANESLNLAGGMDPKAHAKERYNTWVDLTDEGYQNKKLSLMRDLHKKGLLGVSSYAPVEGTKKPEDTAMNPHVAALEAAREGAKADAAYKSMNEGEQYLDRLLQRGNQQENQAYRGAQEGRQQVNMIPPKSAQYLQFAKQIMPLVKESGLFDMAGDVISGWLNPSDPWMSGGYVPDFNFDFGNLGSDWLSGSAYDAPGDLWWY